MAKTKKVGGDPSFDVDSSNESSGISVGMKVFRYSNAFSAPLVHKMTEDYGESNTDTTKWKPSVVQVRSFVSSTSSSHKTLLYDFPDGKDTGETIQTFLRQPGLDITEIETAEKRITQIIESKKLSDEEKNKLDGNMKNLLDAIKSVKGEKTDDTASDAPVPTSAQ